MPDQRRRMRRWATIVFVLLLAVTAAACGDGEAGGGTTEVTLQEWTVLPADASVPAGSVTFTVTNDGPDHPHELVVIKTDLDPAELPTTDDGAVDEDGEGIEVIGEIEEFAPGETQEATFDLEPGSYALVCNVVAMAGEHAVGHDEEEDADQGMGEMEVHYRLGMHAPLTVSG